MISFNEALSSSARNDWMIALRDELDSIAPSLGIGRLPSNHKSIGNKWVPKVKSKAEMYGQMKGTLCVEMLYPKRSYRL